MPERRAMPTLGLALLAACLALLAAGLPEHSGIPESDPAEVAVRLLPLQGDWSDAEFSGLAWRDDDWLLLLPQWPHRFLDDSTASASLGARPDGYLFAIEEDAVEAAAKGEHDEPLALRSVALFAPGIAASVPGFQGYEALAVVGDSAFVTIEAEAEGLMQGYLVAGVIEEDAAGDPTALWLDPQTLTPIPPPDVPNRAINLTNLSYEALVATPREVIALYEANGQIVDPHPRAYVFDHRQRLRRALPFPVLEYRVTDATELDEHGRFWVVNTYWPGDELLLRPAADSLALQYGRGPTHGQSQIVERLVEFRLTGRGVRRTRRPPIQLRLLSHSAARNWEGVVRLEGDGFLLVTDSYPGTMLGFIASEP